MKSNLSVFFVLLSFLYIDAYSTKNVLPKRNYFITLLRTVRRVETKLDFVVKNRLQSALPTNSTPTPFYFDTASEAVKHCHSLSKSLPHSDDHFSIATGLHAPEWSVYHMTSEGHIIHPPHSSEVHFLRRCSDLEASAASRSTKPPFHDQSMAIPSNRHLPKHQCVAVIRGACWTPIHCSKFVDYRCV